MPEGPEVRRHADALHAALAGKRLHHVSARTKAAKAWLAGHPDAFAGRRVERVVSRGKNLVGYVEGDLSFTCHLMMWGRWYVARPAPLDVDRRERARLVADDGTAAILHSAPVFTVGEGDPLRDDPYLAALGPDTLPYGGPREFGAACFVERLTARENREREVGAVLLDQTVAAGIGNYLRAEVLFLCRLDPFRRVADLTDADLACLVRTVPEVAHLAYDTAGVTASGADRERLLTDPSLSYPNTMSDYGRRHYAFRRTNLPCLRCGALIRQRRQVTAVRDDEDGDDKTRIIYFCPVCQGVGDA
jgi:formamidopyrimidine-DNA glycosylase